MEGIHENIFYFIQTRIHRKIKSFNITNGNQCHKNIKILSNSFSLTLWEFIVQLIHDQREIYLSILLPFTSFRNAKNYNSECKDGQSSNLDLLDRYNLQTILQFVVRGWLVKLSSRFRQDRRLHSYAHSTLCFTPSDVIP